MTTKPDTDTGWRKEFPAQGAYWTRGWPNDASDAYEPVIVTINAVGVPSVFRAGDERGLTTLGIPASVEFLGPISPSDFEQLMQLRKQIEEARDVIEGLLDFSDNVIEAFEIRALPAHRACFNRARTLIEALAPTGEQS